MIRNWQSVALTSILTGVLAATAPVLLTYSNEAMPAGFLVRPLIAAIVAGVILGSLSAFTGRFAILISVSTAVALLVPALWAAVLILWLTEGIVQVGQRIRRRPRPRLGRFTMAATAVLFLLGSGRSAFLVTQELLREESADAHRNSGSPVYLVLLDGYPRADTLEHLAIDNSAFLRELGSRGFDYYPQATSAHGHTERVLADILAGKPTGPSDQDPSISTSEETQQFRWTLEWPDSFYVLDPPIGHVTTLGGRHWNAGGVTDLEAHLIGRTAFGVLLRDSLSLLIADTLRDHHRATFAELVRTDEPAVFAHILAPHPPFLYVEDLPACWPARCDAFSSWIEQTGMTKEEWAIKMAGQLDGLNQRVISAVDQVLERRPNAAIVLFSDHGARYSLAERESEWHNVLLASRTPGHPDLYAQEPYTWAVLRLLTDAYQ